MEAWMQNPLRALTLSVKTTPIFQMWYFVSMELSLYIEKKRAHVMNLDVKWRWLVKNLIIINIINIFSILFIIGKLWYAECVFELRSDF